MVKGGKQMLQPGYLGTKFKTHYERTRYETIKKNNEVMKFIGVKRILAFMPGRVQHNRANENRKRSRTELEDDNYVPSNDEDDHDCDNESNDSFDQEDIEMPPGGRAAQLPTEPQRGATLISGRITRSTPHPSIESQALLPPIAQPQNEVYLTTSDKMVQTEAEHNAQEGAIPITQEVLSVDVLKAKSGYVKGHEAFLLC